MVSCTTDDKTDQATLVLEDGIPDADRKYLPIHMDVIYAFYTKYFEMNGANADGQLHEKEVKIQENVYKTIHCAPVDWEREICERADISERLVEELLVRGNYKYEREEAQRVAHKYTLANSLMSARMFDSPIIENAIAGYIAIIWKGKSPEAIRREWNHPYDLTPEDEERIMRENAWIEAV